jgi:electron transfer flavoprotein beta subunit
MLREMSCDGADEAYLLSDRAFGGADTCRDLDDHCGRNQKDRRRRHHFCRTTGQSTCDTRRRSPRRLPRGLGNPQVTYVEEIQSVEDGYAVVKRQLENGYEIIRVQLPCVLTCVKELNTPRYMSIAGILDAYETDVEVWNHDDVGLIAGQCGLTASPTNVFRSFTPPPKGKGEMLCGCVADMAAEVVGRLTEKHAIK